MRRSLGGMLDAVRHDSAPPLAYLLDRLVTPFSTSPAALRLIPAVAGAAAIPLGAALARRCGGDRAGLWGAAVCAASPALVISSRDARMYALATTLVMASALLLWRAVERPSGARWLLYGASVAAAVYSQYFAAFGVVAALIAAGLVLQPPRRRLLIAGGAALAGGLTLAPWLLAARAQLAHGTTPFWVEPVGAKTLSSVVLQLLSGPPVDQGIPGRPWLQALQALAVGAGVMAAYALLRRRRELAPADRRGAAFLAGCGLGGPLLFILVSLWHPLVEARYVSVVWGPLLPLLGAGLALVRLRPLTAGSLIILGSTAAALALVPIHPDSAAVAGDLRGRVGEHDLVSADPDTFLLVLYYGDAATVSRAHVLSDDVPWFWGTAAYPQGAVLRDVPEDVLRHGGTIYHVLDPAAVYVRPPPPGYHLEGRVCHVGVCVESYTPLRSSRARPATG